MSFHDRAFPVLRDALTAMRMAGARCWLEAGTCLGAIRERHLLDHDSDIDLGTADVGAIESIKEEFIDKGFRIQHVFGTPDNGYEVAFVKKGVKVDVFWFYRKGDIMWHSAWVGDKQLFLDFPAERFDKLEWREMGGAVVPVPAEPEKYLKERYGDWETVKTSWSWSEDPLCLRKG